MKVAIYDPFHTFEHLVQESSKYFGEVTYANNPLTPAQRQYLHSTHDVVWYEFCTQDFVYDTNAVVRPAYTVCRLHSYELFTNMPQSANWDRVEKLFVPSSYVKRMLDSQRRDVDYPPIEILANGVDMNKFYDLGGTREPGSVAVVGFINYKKNLPLAVQCLSKCHEISKMYIIGESQDPRFDMYLRHMAKELGIEKRLVFTGKVKHDDLNMMLNNFEFIATFSLFESFGQGMFEGIAAGCKPIIHNFPGAAERFCWFGPLFGTVESFCNAMRYNFSSYERLRKMLRPFSAEESYKRISEIASDIERGIK